MQDLNATGAANSARHRAHCAALVGADPTGRLDRFRELVVTSAFSTNVSADKIIAYGRAEQILDTLSAYRVVEGAPVGTERFEVEQGAYLAGRQAFEAMWEHGHRFVYGAVNAGGMGTEGKYGHYCLVVPDPDEAGSEALGVFPGNSVTIYYREETGVVDEQTACADAAAWTERADVAVATQHEEVGRTSEGGWPAVVCRPDHFLEVAWAPAAQPSAIREARLRSGKYSELLQFVRRAAQKLPLSNSEQNEIRALQTLWQWRNEHGLHITRVPGPE